LPADAAITFGLIAPPTLRASAATRAAAPQALELQPDVGAGAPAERGRRHERRHARQPAYAFRDLAAGDVTPDVGIECAPHGRRNLTGLPRDLQASGDQMHTTRN
jgi:hypothetical protein